MLGTFLESVPLLAVVLVGGILYWATLTVYRLTIHPLSEYPGPLLWRISIWPTVYHCRSGKRHLALLDAHKKYGSIVRVTPNMLSFDTATSARTIYSHKDQNMIKSDFHLTLDATFQAPSVFALIDKREHAFRRRTILNAFSENAMKDSGEFYLKYTRILRDELIKKTAHGWTKVHMGHYSTWWGADVMADLSMGRSFDCLRNPTYRHGMELMRNGSRFAYWAGHLPFNRLVNKAMASSLLTKLGGAQALDNLRYFEYCDAAIAARIREEEEAVAKGRKETPKDYIHHLLDAVDAETGKKLGRNEMKSDISFILAAGSDTTANAFAAVMFYLCRNKRVRDLAAAEVQRVFATADEIVPGEKLLRDCAYLSACIDESMRMAPISSSPLERVVINDGMVVDGHHIPPGTTIGTFFYGMNLAEKTHPKSHEYWPERWLVDTNGVNGLKEDEVAKAKESFFPFTGGRRQCPARIMAHRSLKLVVATMLWNFDFRATDDLDADEPSGEGEEKDIFGLDDAMISITKGPVLEMIYRKAIEE